MRLWLISSYSCVPGWKSWCSQGADRFRIDPCRGHGFLYLWNQRFGSGVAPCPIFPFDLGKYRTPMVGSNMCRARVCRLNFIRCAIWANTKQFSNSYSCKYRVHSCYIEKLALYCAQKKNTFHGGMGFYDWYSMNYSWCVDVNIKINTFWCVSKII